MSKKNTHIYPIFTHACLPTSQSLGLVHFPRKKSRKKSKKYAQHARMINDPDNPPVSSKVSRLRLGWPNGHFANVHFTLDLCAPMSALAREINATFSGQPLGSARSLDISLLNSVRRSPPLPPLHPHLFVVFPFAIPIIRANILDDIGGKSILIPPHRPPFILCEERVQQTSRRLASIATSHLLIEEKCFAFVARYGRAILFVRRIEYVVSMYEMFPY